MVHRRSGERRRGELHRLPIPLLRSTIGDILYIKCGLRTGEACKPFAVRSQPREICARESRNRE